MLRKSIALTTLSIISATTFAATPHYVVAPQCLLQKTQTHFETLATVNSLALIKTDTDGIQDLIIAKTQHDAKPCGGFMDVTSAWTADSTKNIAAKNHAKTFLNEYAFPKANLATPVETYSINYPTQVNQLISNLNPRDLLIDLTHLTSYPDRYADSQTGVNALSWIRKHILDIATTNNRDDVSSFLIPTVGFKQSSLVIKIGNADASGIVIGAHMDTLDHIRFKQLMPGADDDGSGTTSLLEVARLLLSSNMHFQKPIYLVWYSAEEEGLYGSQNVVEYFVRKRIPVSNVLQLDMTGYRAKNDPTIWMITDNINTNLSAYIETLITTYVNVPVSRTQCGYACSDHASWNKVGINAAFPFEAKFGTEDPYIHSQNDTMNALSVDHMVNFAKLGTAFAVELAEPVA